MLRSWHRAAPSWLTPWDSQQHRRPVLRRRSRDHRPRPDGQSRTSRRGRLGRQRHPKAGARRGGRSHRLLRARRSRQPDFGSQSVKPSTRPGVEVVGKAVFSRVVVGHDIELGRLIARSIERRPLGARTHPIEQADGANERTVCREHMAWRSLPTSPAMCVVPAPSVGMRTVLWEDGRCDP
jgi:hypothetical protein